MQLPATQRRRPTYLAIGLTGTELKDHLKFSIAPYYLISLIMLVFGVLLGIITI